MHYYISCGTFIRKIALTNQVKYRVNGKIDTTKLPPLLQEYLSETDTLFMHRKTKVIMTQSDINQIKQDTAPPVDIDTLDDFENMDITDDTK